MAPTPSRLPAGLVVERDEDIARMLAEVLAFAGYTVLESTSPDEALSTLRSTPERLLTIFSNSCPGNDEAMAFFTQVVADGTLAWRHTYLYLTTDPTELPRALRATLRALGAPVIAKPFELDTLVAAIHRVRAQPVAV
jgi:DNA-binding response OmpR family regulator